MKRIRNILVIMIALLAALSMAGCDFLFGSMAFGKVVNVFAEGDSSTFYKTSGTETLVGATISVSNLDDSGFSYSVPVADDGSFSIGGLTPGRYRISGSKTGWAFVPQEVFVGGTFLEFPDVLAYPTSEAGALTVILAWDEEDYDVDLKATYGTPINNDNTHIIQSGLLGNNTSLIEGTTGSSAGYSMTLERDVTLDTPASYPRVETISIDAAPNPVGLSNYTGGHEIRFYADIFSKDDGTQYGDPAAGSLTGDDSDPPAYARLYVMYGTEHYGTWELPLNSAEKTINMLNVYVYNNGGQSGFFVYSTGNFGDDVYRSIQE